MRRRRQPLKVVVNEGRRAGLAEIEKPRTRAPFQTAGFDLGPSLIGSVDDVEGVLARVEGEGHRWHSSTPTCCSTPRTMTLRSLVTPVTSPGSPG